ncbi:calcium/sodium antiporter [Jannaschia sp. LMIT008]|uniref:calcium/sodium antiporter n=1 Tax=Jannaschia maritima TaxID=3032585 RepID=UPI002811C392|nr:calcium/sodium antiporter [Jannaschia sp. LMIT008]
MRHARQAFTGAASIMVVLQLLLGFALLVAGGEALVRGAVGLAERLRVSPLVIGLTIVGFGTSAPELVTSLQAALAGAPGIAVGNVVGSNIANVALILGLTALIAPLAVARAGFARDGLALALATGACVAVVLGGALNRWMGALLVAGLAAYVAVAYRAERDTAPAEEGPTTPAVRPWRAAALTAAGIATVILGARVAVDAAIELAALWGLSQAVVGLTVVAVGTSLPELVTSVVAASRRQPGLAFGNVVGSNICNVGGILGLTALIAPIDVPDRIATLDVWVMAGVAAGLIALVISRQRIGRIAGGLFLAGYAAYTAWLVAGT